MDALTKLRDMGYLVRAEGDQIRCSWQGSGKPDPSVVRPLLNQLRDRKAEALAELRGEASQPKPWTFATRDPDRPGWFVARRPGSPLEGRGPTEFDACLSLWDQEEAVEREQKEADRDPA
ncbi:MAG: hypothetical protein A3F84_25155 [Candidatus Handelsmanbacteria bacterium RIFCSPLOWO2_12_FULL_64_10]|uniref:Uncharacterized protein n=1 Tax=Handelsmanbacteria sp. (strain RIFCSPLOWO2_12_FULL_64_10) TaxID=1817868 RepID=A0A1F6CCQ8_HANXR|nr:MAG: hypothetical protein A3F84_25155 [Candidatus Handelsmanbacteria bacterium RIFCSPLOWO2_12_FULL_64_10]